MQPEGSTPVIFDHFPDPCSENPSVYFFRHRSVLLTAEQISLRSYEGIEVEGRTREWSNFTDLPEKENFARILQNLAGEGEFSIVSFLTAGQELAPHRESGWIAGFWEVARQVNVFGLTRKRVEQTETDGVRELAQIFAVCSVVWGRCAGGGALESTREAFGQVGSIASGVRNYLRAEFRGISGIFTSWSNDMVRAVETSRKF